MFSVNKTENSSIKMEPLGLDIVVDQITIGSRTKFQVKIVALHSTSYKYMCMVTVALYLPLTFFL